MSDIDELAQRLASIGERATGIDYSPNRHLREALQPEKDDAEPSAKLTQWSTSDGVRFNGAATTTKTLPPGLYDIKVSVSLGVHFERVPVKSEGLLRFPHTNADRVLAEIATFWERKDIFQSHGLCHKRGILLWGPPGSGKSSTIQLLLEDVTTRGGIAVRFGLPALFLSGMRTLRQVQPDTPVVVLMEDLDSIIQSYSESEVLNILDGVEMVDHTVFLASTNYPEMLGPRIVNRPSRFDKRIKIGHPTPESRHMYLRHLVGKDVLDLDRWVNDSDGFSFAHLRELFIAVVILGDSYDDAIQTLRSMKEEISSEKDYQERRGIGLLNQAAKQLASARGIETTWNTR